MLSNYDALPKAYEEYLMNSDKDLDVVDLWSGVKSIVFAARTARAACYQGHQHLQAEGLTSTGLLASQIRIDKGANISLVWKEFAMHSN